jgi:hypothetical protein
MSLSVADLEAQLAAARVEAEQAAKDAAVRAKEFAARQRVVVGQARTKLDALEVELGEALAAAPDDGLSHRILVLRGRCRTFLYGGDWDMTVKVPTADRWDPLPPSRPLELIDLCSEDPVAGRLLGLSQGFGQVLVRLTGEAGLLPSDELVVRCDAAECRAWAGVMTRLRGLAGEGA